MPEMQTNGLRLHYEVIGQGDPVLLIMGLGAQLVWWDEALCALLASRGFQVIRFDNRDIGLSTHFDHLGVPPIPRLLGRRMARLPVAAPYTLEDMSDDTAGLLDGLGIARAHVVGASMGGMIAQTLALRHPARVASLTSIMSHTGRRRHLVGRPGAIRALLTRPQGQDREAVLAHGTRMLKTFCGAGMPVPEEEIRARVALAFDRSYHPQGVSRQLAAILASGDRSAALRGVQAPALVIHGDQDPLIRLQGGLDTAKSLPNATLQVVRGMGHNLPRGMWGALADGLERLRAPSPGRGGHPGHPLHDVEGGVGVEGA
jgi:pimeloyl-ACP methyl ester carboxylesterase